MNKILLGIFIGVIMTASLSYLRLWANNESWQMSAYNHGCAYYSFNIKERNPKFYWHWSDGGTNP